MSAPGTQHRNRCPNCLWSRHVDDVVPGDRAADHAGSMEPIGVSVRDDGEWALVHRCTACSTVHVSRIAGDDARVDRRCGQRSADAGGRRRRVYPAEEGRVAVAQDIA
jgi:RNHCP domain